MKNISPLLPELLKYSTPKKITVYGPANKSVKKIQTKQAKPVKKILKKKPLTTKKK